MKKIEQALFGYSNGHRLLGSSIKLSTPSLRLMEMLSDLSGNDTSKDFDGYYTGCWLADDDYYAICKTWYATEMPRPGCAWTHALFLDCKTYATDANIPIDQLFQRPSIGDNNFLSHYKNSIQIEGNGENNDMEKCEIALWLLHTIISKKENIAICYNGIDKINCSFEYLFQLMGVRFFTNFSFCTGSQANRTIKEKPLNIQIMPTKISKVALRALTTVSPFEKTADGKSVSFVTDAKELLKIKQFALNLDKQYYSFEVFQGIQEIYYTLYSDNTVDLYRLISMIQNTFSSDDVIKIFDKSIGIYIADLLKNNHGALCLLELFTDISTMDEKYDSLINVLDVSEFEKYLFEIANQHSESLLPLISKLLVSELNDFGEELLKRLAFIIDSNALVQMLSEKETHSTVLLQFNWRLAKNKFLWEMPLAIQSDMVRNMAIAFKQSSNEDRAAFSEVLCLIFEISNEYIAEQIYSAFGDFSITTYFTWLSDKKNFNKNNWLLICKSNPCESLCLLKAASNADSELFYKLLQILNPWNKSMCLVEAVTLEDLYRKYCQSGNIPDLNDLFAKFVLQVMISTKMKFSDELSCFAFMRVHKILESPNFDTSFWNAISPHLPEVKWYNSWDKCKRLRKFAKKEGYTNIFI